MKKKNQNYQERNNLGLISSPTFTFMDSMVERLYNRYMDAIKLWRNVKLKRKILSYKTNLNEKKESWKTK